MRSNPFDSDVEEVELQDEVSKKKASTQKPKKVSILKAKKAPAPAYAGGSETDDEPIPCAQPKKRKRIQPIADSEDELEPVRASALKNFFSRRTDAGSSFQSNPSCRGEYYVELRIYNVSELESSRLSDRDKCKLALIHVKTSVNGDSTLWRSVLKVVSDAKQQFKGVRPVIYPTNIL